MEVQQTFQIAGRAFKFHVLNITFVCKVGWLYTVNVCKSACNDQTISQNIGLKQYCIQWGSESYVHLLAIRSRSRAHVCSRSAREMIESCSQLARILIAI